MSDFQFVIEDSVEIPKREFGGGTRHSEFGDVLESMHNGQSFLLPIEGDDAEAAKKKAAQRQSYLSSLAKRRGLKVVTRFYPDGEDGKGLPALRVWRDGKRTAEDDAKDAARAAKRAATARETGDGALATDDFDL